MTCKHCGKEINDGASVCPFCKKELAAPVEIKVEENSNQGEDKKSNTKNVLSIIIIILGLFCVIVGCILLFSNNNNLIDNNQESNNNNNNNINESNNNSKLVNKLLSYSGVYSNGENTLILYVAGTNSIHFEINYNSISLELDDSDNLVYIDNFDLDNENIEVKINKTDDGINVIANSSLADSDFNKISGTYTKENFENTWSGYYKNGDTEIIIDEYKNNSIQLSIQKDYSTSSFMVSDYTENNIDYVRILFEEKDVINIKKTNNGISVTASAVDNEDLLNKINGTYTLIK